MDKKYLELLEGFVTEVTVEGNEVTLTLTAKLEKIKKHLKANGFGRVGIIKGGFQVRDHLYGYSNTSPYDSEVLLKLEPLKNDGEYLLTVRALGGK